MRRAADTSDDGRMTCRHAAVLDGGGSILPETRHWHEDTGVSTSGRETSDPEDYRYVPDPDLLPLEVGANWVDAVRQSMPELPGAMRTRFVHEYALTDYDAAVLTSSRETADYFEALLRVLPSQPKLCANCGRTGVMSPKPSASACATAWPATSAAAPASVPSPP